jgi:hypothetical protein
MKIPSWLAALLILGWTIWSVNYLYCKKCGCCASATTSTIPVSLTGVPLFHDDSCRVVTNDLTSTWCTSQVANYGPGDTLIITGRYCASEKNACGSADIGMERALAVKQLFSSMLNDSRILCRSEMTTLCPSDRGYHEYVSCARLPLRISTTESSVIETRDSVMILFPPNSTEKEKDEKIEDYLNSLCALHATDSIRFLITGHTDDIGDAESNYQLGLDRAYAVQNTLLTCGINKRRITAASEGELQPIADNTTESGRQFNRRVIVRMR